MRFFCRRVFEIAALRTQGDGRWAAVVAGHQRHGHQHLIFNQRLQIEISRQLENVVLGFIVQCGSGIFVRDEDEVTIDLNRRLHGFHAALASQGQICLHVQVNGGAHAAVHRRPQFALRLPFQGQICLWRPQVARQALIFLKRFFARDLRFRLRERGDVEMAWIEVLAHTISVRESTHMTASTPFTPLARPLILGSTSRYRRELLLRLQLPFEAIAPEVDETPAEGEAPQALAQRLALAKARDVAARHPDAVVIGSDQVADLHGEPLGKPGTHEKAVDQLRRMRGQTVIFQTALAVVCQATQFQQTDLAAVEVRFRDLSDAEIERYLRAEQPYDCAGSAKSEGLGIALLDAIQSDDPTALIGLPLIRTARLLRAAGLTLP